MVGLIRRLMGGRGRAEDPAEDRPAPQTEAAAPLAPSEFRSPPAAPLELLPDPQAPARVTHVKLGHLGPDLAGEDRFAPLKQVRDTRAWAIALAHQLQRDLHVERVDQGPVPTFHVTATNPQGQRPLGQEDAQAVLGFFEHAFDPHRVAVRVANVQPGKIAFGDREISFDGFRHGVAWVGGGFVSGRFPQRD